MARICRDLEQRINKITACGTLVLAAHASADDMLRELTHAGNRHDYRLLKAYEKFLSLDYPPHTIKKVLAALSGREDYIQEDTSDTVFEMLSTAHLDAYRHVFTSLDSDHPSLTPIAQTAARHPELSKQIVEQAIRGDVEPDQALTQIKEQNPEELLRS